MRNRISGALLLAMTLILASCSVEPPTSVGSDIGANATLNEGIVAGPLGTMENNTGYDVQYDGRVFDGTQTTFSYTITGEGASQELVGLGLEVPTCAPELNAIVPGEGVQSLIFGTPIYGVNWDISSSGSVPYAITFDGDVPEGIIYALLSTNESGGGNPAGDITLIVVPGPCGGFDISGTVYSDADASNSFDVEENGIPDVTVTLTDEFGDESTTVTDASGHYSFFRVAGDYTVQVLPVTAATDFNEALVSSFDASGATSLSVTTGPDALNNHFGYEPQTEELIVELETGVLLTDGVAVKFWARELRSAIHAVAGGGGWQAALCVHCAGNRWFCG